jgi:hemimethylated DNA binding protein
VDYLGALCTSNKIGTQGNVNKNSEVRYRPNRPTSETSVSRRHFDVDPIYYNSEEWLNSMHEGNKPSRDQPYYHLLAENSETSYIAYVSEQNLLLDEWTCPVKVPDTYLIYAAKLSNARGLLPPNVECLRRGL